MFLGKKLIFNLSKESQAQLNQAKLEALAGEVLGDIVGAVGFLLSYIGDQTGVCRAMVLEARI
ncbi:MAG TPA: hypothetical protein DCO70_03700 [Verrucomicrobiales bacterium]|nr:hypothetical protein [Verrucomicrobiales bacterium]HAH98412.1 hypothetical protein [Verrucomicrobiales bacterium]